MSDLPTVPSSKKHKQQPFSAEEFKLKLLKDAGIGDERLIAVTRKVFDSAEAELEATKQTPVTDHGRITDIHEQPDYAARSRAREQLIDLIGLKGKSGDGGSGGVKVEISAPMWLQRPSVSVAVQPQSTAPVIDVLPQPESVSSDVLETPDPPLSQPHEG